MSRWAAFTSYGKENKYRIPDRNSAPEKQHSFGFLCFFLQRGTEKRLRVNKTLQRHNSLETSVASYSRITWLRHKHSHVRLCRKLSTDAQKTSTIRHRNAAPCHEFILTPCFHRLKHAIFVNFNISSRPVTDETKTREVWTCDPLNCDETWTMNMLEKHTQSLLRAACSAIIFRLLQCIMGNPVHLEQQMKAKTPD